MNRRSGLKDHVGGAMLRRIQEFCAERGFSRIRLEALAPVITLYHKFGWRFVRRTNHREKPEITAAIQELTREIVAIRKSAIPLDRVDAAVAAFIEESNKDMTSSWWRLRDLLERNGYSALTNELGDTIYTQVRRAEKGFEEAGIDYGVGMDLRKALPSWDDAEDLEIDSTGELARVDPQACGYTMIWSPRWGFVYFRRYKFRGAERNYVYNMYVWISTFFNYICGYKKLDEKIVKQEVYVPEDDWVRMMTNW